LMVKGARKVSLRRNAIIRTTVTSDSKRKYLLFISGIFLMFQDEPDCKDQRCNYTGKRTRHVNPGHFILERLVDEFCQEQSGHHKSCHLKGQACPGSIGTQ
jgi:hypothetical protein